MFWVQAESDRKLKERAEMLEKVRAGCKERGIRVGYAVFKDMQRTLTFPHIDSVRASQFSSFPPSLISMPIPTACPFLN